MQYSYEFKTRAVEKVLAQGPDVSFNSVAQSFGIDHSTLRRWVGKFQNQSLVEGSTAKDRFARAVSAVNEWCKRNRHQRVDKQAAHLGRVIRGHCNYYGVTGNSRRLAQFHRRVEVIWRKWLSRRSRKGQVGWEQMKEILRRNPLPKVKVVRSIYTT